MLEDCDAELKLVIAGNHDISLDEEYYQREGMRMHRHTFDPKMPKQAKEMWTGEEARKAGVTYLEEGSHTFILKSGAKLRVCFVIFAILPALHSSNYDSLALQK